MFILIRGLFEFAMLCCQAGAPETQARRRKQLSAEAAAQQD